MLEVIYLLRRSQLTSLISGDTAWGSIGVLG